VRMLATCKSFAAYAAAIVDQDRDHNFCLSLFWNYWWPIMFIIYPFIGRIWCVRGMRAVSAGLSAWHAGCIGAPARCRYCSRQQLSGHLPRVQWVHAMRL
jgi:hypothetical protein